MASSLSSLQDERWAIVGSGGLYTLPLLPPAQDYTIEILMTHLSARARASFFTPPSVDPCGDGDETPSSHAQALSTQLGISDIFPRNFTQLDAYSFAPCGYSSNALIKYADHGPDSARNSNNGTGEGYYTIHVTPEEGWSYASFECNVPLAPKSSGGCGGADGMPDLRTVIQRVVRIFEPGKLTVTLFMSSAENAQASEEDGGETAIEAAQRAFKAALTRPQKRPPKHGTGSDGIDPSTNEKFAGDGDGDKRYKRTDKINYEFGGYDLAFASFEMI